MGRGVSSGSGRGGRGRGGGMGREMISKISISKATSEEELVRLKLFNRRSKGV